MKNQIWEVAFHPRYPRKILFCVSLNFSCEHFSRIGVLTACTVLVICLAHFNLSLLLRRTSLVIWVNPGVIFIKIAKGQTASKIYMENGIPRILWPDLLTAQTGLLKKQPAHPVYPHIFGCPIPRWLLGVITVLCRVCSHNVFIIGTCGNPYLFEFSTMGVKDTELPEY